ncbi:MAG: pyruvate formate lyase family protein [Anaerolineae bacterium]
MRELVQRIRSQLMGTPDTVCLQRARLVTEAYQRYAAAPAPLRRARAFAHILQHMDLDLVSNPIFAGNTSSRPRAWMLVPEHGFGMDAQILLENEGLEHLLDDSIPPDLRAFWADKSFGGNSGIGHLAVDLRMVVSTGLAALIDQVRAHADDGNKQQGIYRQAMAVALQAVIDWAGRYADAAEQAAEREMDPVIRLAHQRVAVACRQVPAYPARSLFEGLQAIALVHLAIAIEGHGLSISLGLPDRALAHLIEDHFDHEQATELIKAFMLKIAANSFQGRGSKTQAITVGGADHRGRDASNALTRCFLEACDQVRLGDPHLFLRWHSGLAPDIRRRAAQMLANGVSMPLLINDNPTAQGFINAGVTPEDAWEYCVIGCNELGIPGRSAESATTMGGTVEYLETLNQVLLGHTAPDTLRSIPELLDAVENRLACEAESLRTQSERYRVRMADEVPTPFTSALMQGCIARGCDMLTGMTYHLPGVYERGLSNAANALAAIERNVFEQHALTISELVQALRSNFGDSQVKSRLLAAPKWGNDDPRADHWAVALVELRERVLDQVDAAHGGRRHMSCHVVRSLHHLDGMRIAASADGRLAGSPVGDSIGAVQGTQHAGATALLNSVLKLDASRFYRGGYNLNLTLPARGTSADDVLALIEAFFGRGGQELQVSCLDVATLREAQQQPERHGDLLVRIAGFSARFVDLAPLEQQEIISRAEAV